jgi:hypothetical protein
MKMQDLRVLCIDRVVPLQHKIKAADIAQQENVDNRPNPDAIPAGVGVYTLKIALLTSKRWSNGRVLGVRFLDGSELQRQNTIKYATLWSQFANVRFNFDTGNDAEIRISFEADPGSWSAVGTDCLLAEVFPNNEPTVNFGWLREDTDDVEWRRVVTHEFGHVLGAIHEHQNPRGNLIQWNKQAVYSYFSGPPNFWSKDEIDFNILDKYSLAQLNATRFDRKSIMLYQFPPELTLNHVGTASNTQLSMQDERFVAEMYPKPDSSPVRHEATNLEERIRELEAASSRTQEQLQQVLQLSTELAAQNSTLLRRAQELESLADAHGHR